MNIFNNRKILVTGAAGLIGRELLSLLRQYKPKTLIGNSLELYPEIDVDEYYNYDLTETEGLHDLFKDIDYVFHLAGIKGSPQMAAKKPASFCVPMIQFNTNAMEYARRANVKWQLYTSSIGVYHPAPLLKEDDVWKTMPSPNDRFAGWAKRIGELQLQAYQLEYGLNNTSIVRPANVYGAYDNFGESGMVIPSLIRRVCSGENPLKVWGNGEQIRDFIHAKDVARGMIFAIENKITEPINLGSGIGVKIKDLVQTIVDTYKEITDKTVSVIFDPSKPTGDAIRLMDMTKSHNYGFKCEVSLKDGIKETILWYLSNKDTSLNRFDGFKS